MSSQHEISEYIDNLPLEKRLCRGFRPDDVYEVICNISSMYNQLLSEAYTENEELKNRLEHMENGKQIEKREETMTDKELQRLKRGDLLEILLEMSKENEALKLQLEEKDKSIELLNDKLASRKIDLEEAGTIAEASFKLNGVFEAAEKAAQQYLDNLHELCERESYLYSQREAEVETRCNALLQATQERCDFMKEDVLKKCEDMEANVRKQCENLLLSTELKCREREKESEEKLQIIDRKAKSDVDKRWEELSKRLENFYTSRESVSSI